MISDDSEANEPRRVYCGGSATAPSPPLLKAPDIDSLWSPTLVFYAGIFGALVRECAYYTTTH